MSVVIRPALPQDTDAVRWMTRNVWEGTDYLPYVWDRWLTDANGYLMAATQEGMLVGVQHVQLMPDGSAWAEGIRVAEDRQGSGIGQLLLDEAVRWARSIGCPALRLSTYSENPASNRIAERAGLGQLASLSILSAPPAHGGTPAGNVHVAAPTDRSRIWSFVREELDRAAFPPFYTEGWTAHQLTESRLSLLLGTAAVLVAGRGRIEGLAIATSTLNRPTLKLGLLLGERDAAGAIAAYLRGCLRSAGLREVRATLCMTVDTEAALTGAGYHIREEVSMLLHEIRLGG